MDMQVFAEYKAETDPRRKAALLNRLVRENEKFAHKHVIALLRRRQVPQSDAGDYEDLLQAAMIGLAKAIEKYDPERGCFSSYASHWIRHEAQQCALHDVTIYRPKGAGIPYAALQKREEVLQREGREATAEELDEACGGHGRVTEASLAAWRCDPFVSMSLDEGVLVVASRVGRGEMVNLHDAIPDDAEGPDERMGACEAGALSLELLDMLEPRERQVIVKLFLEEKGIAKVCQELAMSPLTVSTIRDRALAKLREEVTT